MRRWSLRGVGHRSWEEPGEHTDWAGAEEDDNETFGCEQDDDFEDDDDSESDDFKDNGFEDDVLKLRNFCFLCVEASYAFAMHALV